MTTTRTASTLRRLAGTVVALGMLAACGQSGAPASDDPYGAGGSVPSSPAAATTSAPGATAPAGALELRMADSSLGSILVDARGMTLYMFTKDSANTSACEGQCLVNWPPLLGAPSEGDGVDDSKLGSFPRSDGRVQATYNGWPLYYRAEDTKPGDTAGQNVQGGWFVLNRDGDPVREPS